MQQCWKVPVRTALWLSACRECAFLLVNEVRAAFIQVKPIPLPQWPVVLVFTGRMRRCRTEVDINSEFDSGGMQVLAEAPLGRCGHHSASGVAEDGATVASLSSKFCES